MSNYTHTPETAALAVAFVVLAVFVLGGADLSAFAGPILGGGIYAALWLTTAPYRDPARRPVSTEGDAAATSADQDETTTDAPASASPTMEVTA